MPSTLIRMRNDRPEDTPFCSRVPDVGSSTVSYRVSLDCMYPYIGRLGSAKGADPSLRLSLANLAH